MNDEPLRQPRTFWQWLTNQPGTIYHPLPTPPPLKEPRPPSALDYLESELVRVHQQIENIRCDDASYLSDKAGLALIDRHGKLHDELARCSQAETKAP